MSPRVIETADYHGCFVRLGMVGTVAYHGSLV